MCDTLALYTLSTALMCQTWRYSILILCSIYLGLIICYHMDIALSHWHPSSRWPLPNAAIELTHHLQRRSSTRLAVGRCLVFARMWGHVGNMRSCWRHEVMSTTWSHPVNMWSCWQYEVMLPMLWNHFQAFALRHFLALPTRFAPTGYS